jgi:hypothetical protein
LARAYQYDPIGNRLSSGEGTPPVTTTYSSNGLNQYWRTERPTPKSAQGFRYDDDGNLVESFVAAPVGPAAVVELGTKQQVPFVTRHIMDREQHGWTPRRAGSFRLHVGTAPRPASAAGRLVTRAARRNRP